MKLSELGEFGLIHRFAPHFIKGLPKGIEGIGDDCAIIPYKENHSLLVTTDLLIEDVHFLKNHILPEDLGYKSLAVNLSDIAAMGGMPLYAFLSLGLPQETDIAWIDRFFLGLEKFAHEEHVLLLGGDTTKSSSVIINILILGEIQTNHIKRRSAAQIGDLICCTGYVGTSGAGLKVLLDQLPLNDLTIPLVNEHHHPRPHLKEGQWLGTQASVHAMIDVSDGIDSDIRRIMEQSQCGAQIHLDQIPLSPLLLQAAQQFGWNPKELALTGGEDYCLLLTIDPQHYLPIQQEYQKLFHRPLFKIGEITGSPLELTYFDNHHPVQIQQRGYDHFSQNT